MPIYRGILRYHEDLTGLDWSLTNYREAGVPVNYKAVADVFNTAYLGMLAETVHLVDFRVSEVDVYRDMDVYPASGFAQQDGQIAGEATEIGSYAQWRGQGGTSAMSSSAWKLHGVSESLVNGSALDLAAPEVVALANASLVYFQQYRPLPTDNLPAVLVPQDFPSGAMAGMYFRRLGRPFGLPGQSR